MQSFAINYKPTQRYSSQEKKWHFRTSKLSYYTYHLFKKSTHEQTYARQPAPSYSRVWSQHGQKPHWLILRFIDD